MITPSPHYQKPESAQDHSILLMGDHRVMSRISTAQGCLLSLLSETDTPLNDYYRHGLLLALKELTGVLEARVSYLEEQHLCPGGEHAND